MAAVTGCVSSRASVSVSSALNPAIVITYSPVFTDYAASGNLNLLLDMTIENKGYQSFNTSPDQFAVTVNNYTYSTRESELPAIDLPDGGLINGKLVFQVPAVAATTRVGFQVKHSGQTQYNVQWHKKTSPPETGSPAANPVIKITYTGNYMWVKESSSLYLLVDLNIENKGYASFYTSPEYFSLMIGNIFGRPGQPEAIKYDGELSDLRDGAYSDLRTYDLQNGGKLTGTLAFQVPANVLASTESYHLEYSGVRDYNIEWISKPPQENK
jgi:hypothetical protein